MDIVQGSGIDTNRASYCTFVRYVKKMGYAFYNSRKKGVMTEKDFQKRRMFARSNSKKGIEYWTRDIAFYLDGVSFVYKGNPLSDVVKPKSCIWRKRQEGLQITTKGSKDLAGGRRSHLIVAIAYGRGVICAEPYERMFSKMRRAKQVEHATISCCFASGICQLRVKVLHLTVIISVSLSSTIPFFTKTNGYLLVANIGVSRS